MSDEEIYERVFILLKKMALLDKPHCNLNEIVCKRGLGNDATYLYASEFREARVLLKELGIVLLDK